MTAHDTTVPTDDLRIDWLAGKHTQWLPFILIPLLLGFAVWAFFGVWDKRAAVLEEQLCATFAKIADNIPDCHVELGINEPLVDVPSWQDLLPWSDGGNSAAELGNSETVVRRGAKAGHVVLVRHIDSLTRKAREAGPEFTPNKERCSPVALSSFSLFLPAITQEGTYDSIARKIEACYGSGDGDKPVKLCQGTREQPKDLCGRTISFVSTMQAYDKNTGKSDTLKLTLASAIYGICQFASLCLALLGLTLSARMMRRLSVKAEDISGLAELSGRMSASAAAKFAHMKAEDDLDPKRLNVFMTLRENFKSLIAGRFHTFENWGDLIVLLGLLGTLYGMITLFGSLSESGSSDALTAELAKSKMLGSLGLAFGTTLFAGLVRFLYIAVLPGRSSLANELIDRAFMRTLRQVRVEDVSFASTSDDPFSNHSLRSVGRKLLASVTLNDTGSTFAAETQRKAKVWATTIWFLLLIGTTSLLIYTLIDLDLLEITADWAGATNDRP